jgi:hemoglobin/transferrin/lactoferrin receptor protein
MTKRLSKSTPLGSLGWRLLVAGSFVPAYALAQSTGNPPPAIEPSVIVQIQDDDDEEDTPSTLPPTDVEAPDDPEPPPPAPTDEPPEPAPVPPGGEAFEQALDTAGNESIITSERIDQNVTRSLSDVFRYEPGIQVQSSIGRFGETSINIRGLEGNRVLMSVDGVRAPDAFQQGPIQLGRAAIEPTLLKQVDIVRGPGSLIYGEGGLGGVVAFETKDPDDFLGVLGKDTYFGINGSYFSAYSGWAETPVMAFRLGDIEILAAYTRRDANEVDTKGAFGADPQDLQSDYFLGKIVYHSTPDNELDFAIEYQNQDVFTNLRSVLADPPGFLNTFVTTPEVFPSALPGSRFLADAKDENQRTRFSITDDYENPAGGVFSHVRLQIYYQESFIQDTRLQRFLVPAVVPPFVPNRHIIDDVNANFFTQEHFGGRAIVRGEHDNGYATHGLIFGVDALRTETGRLRTGTIFNRSTGTSVNSNQISEPTPEKVLPDVVTDRVGLFFRDRIESEFFPITITPGVRTNYYAADFDVPDPLFDDSNGTPEDITEWNVQPLIEFGIPLTEKVEGVVRYTRGYRAPPVEDAGIGFTNPLFGYTVIPNTELGKEVSDSTDVGLTYKGEWLAAYVGGYYNLYDGFIESVDLGLDPNTGLLEFQQQNLDAQIYGVEFAGELRLLGDMADASNNVGIERMDDRGGEQFAAGRQEFYGLSAFGNLSHSVGDNLEVDVPLDSIPPLYGIAGLRYRALENRWGVELISTMVHRKDRYSGVNPDQFITPGYGILDLLSYWNVSENVQFNAGVFNLLDKEYYQWLNVRGVEVNQRDRTRYAAPGINFAATMRVQW